MNWHDLDWIGAGGLLLAFWARLEHRLTKIEGNVMPKEEVEHRFTRLEAKANLL